MLHEIAMIQKMELALNFVIVFFFVRFRGFCPGFLPWLPALKSAELGLVHLWGHMLR